MKTIIEINLIANVFAAGVYFGTAEIAVKPIKQQVYGVIITLSIVFLGDIWAVLFIALTIAALIQRWILKPLHLWFILKHVIFKKPLPGFEIGKHEIFMKKIKTKNPKWYNIDERITIKLAYWIDRNYAKNSLKVVK